MSSRNRGKRYPPPKLNISTSRANTHHAMGALTVIVPVAGLILCLGLFALGMQKVNDER